MPTDLYLYAREGLAATLVLAAAAILHGMRRTPPGRRRLAVAAPVLLAFLLLPLLFSHTDEALQVLSATNFSFLGATAVLAWALGKGPLAGTLPFPTFLVYLVAAATPADPAGPGSRRARLDVTATLAKSAALAAAIHALCCRSMPGWLASAAQSLAWWLWVSLTVYPAAAAAGWLTGLPAAEPFAQPYLSATLADFWRRWNNTPIRKGLRDLVYAPLCGPPLRRSGHPPAWRRWLAACAMFAASGVGHELTLAYLTHDLDGRWLLFFCLQGPLLVAEAWVRTLARQARIRVPRALGTALTLGLVHAMACWLLFPQLVDSGVPTRLLAQLWPAHRLGDMCGAALR